MSRIKQFVSYILSFFYKIDIKFLMSYLNDRELYYFNKLLKTERQHCIRVAKKCVKEHSKFNISKYELNLAIKMCLLHDIGKSYSNLNLFFKPFIVIILKNKKIRKYMFFLNKCKVCTYIRHSEYSYNILKDFNYSKDILYSIRYHHSTNKIIYDVSIDNRYVNLLRYCDNSY